MNTSVGDVPGEPGKNCYLAMKMPTAATGSATRSDSDHGDKLTAWSGRPRAVCETRAPGPAGRSGAASGPGRAGVGPRRAEDLSDRRAASGAPSGGVGRTARRVGGPDWLEQSREWPVARMRLAAPGELPSPNPQIIKIMHL